jgi:hypothetical protein
MRISIRSTLPCDWDGTQTSLQLFYEIRVEWISRRNRIGGDDREEESWRSSLGNHNFLGESANPNHKAWCSSIKSITFSNVVKSNTKTPLDMWQMKDHVCPVLARRIPTLCVVFRTLFQEHISYIKPEKLIMDKSILNGVYFLYVIYDISKCSLKFIMNQ